jgi:hypothetical protein
MPHLSPEIDRCTQNVIQISCSGMYSSCRDEIKSAYIDRYLQILLTREESKTLVLNT